MRTDETPPPAFQPQAHEPERSRRLADTPNLNALASTRLVRGILPADVPARLMAGAGQNGVCSLCDLRIPSFDVEYDVSVMHLGRAQSFLFHIACYDAWVRACRARLRTDDHARP